MEQIFLETAEHAVDAIKSNSRVRPCGAGTKSALRMNRDNQVLLDCRGLDGLLEYEPTEFTFTARAGTPITRIQNELTANSQFLPFDPPFVGQGATLGGAIASGLNGSCSLRYGGARDFILGIKFVDGLGNHATAGGKVVKNAAGFDLPKFMVGSYGYFGLLTELTLKVFPKPELQETLIFDGNLPSAIQAIKKLILTPLEIDAIDICPNQLVIRLGGSADSIASAAKRIRELIDLPVQSQWSGDDESNYWADINRFSWTGAPLSENESGNNHSNVLVKIPCQLNSLDQIVRTAIETGSKYRVAVGGQVVYLSTEPDAFELVVQKLREARFDHLALAGAPAENPLPKGGLWDSLRQALDPEHRFSGD